MKVLMGKPSSNEGFPIAMFDYQRVRWRWLVDEKNTYITGWGWLLVSGKIFPSLAGAQKKTRWPICLDRSTIEVRLACVHLWKRVLGVQKWIWGFVYPAQPTNKSVKWWFNRKSWGTIGFWGILLSNPNGTFPPLDSWPLPYWVAFMLPFIGMEDESPSTLPL